MTHSPEVTLFVAAAGYGKSTALEAAKPRDGVVRPARVVLEDGVPARGWLGIDDLHELTDQEQVLLLDALADLPGGARVAAASRRPLTPAVRARLRGRIRERGAADLALDALRRAPCAHRRVRHPRPRAPRRGARAHRRVADAGAPRRRRLGPGPRHRPRRSPHRRALPRAAVAARRGGRRPAPTRRTPLPSSPGSAA